MDDFTLRKSSEWSPSFVKFAFSGRSSPRNNGKVYPSDDFPPRRLLEEPIATGSARGERLDIGCYDQMLTEYYRLRGWDAETGIPTNEKQQELGLI